MKAIKEKNASDKNSKIHKGTPQNQAKEYQGKTKKTKLRTNQERTWNTEEMQAITDRKYR